MGTTPDRSKREADRLRSSRGAFSPLGRTMLSANDTREADRAMLPSSSRFFVTPEVSCSWGATARVSASPHPAAIALLVGNIGDVLHGWRRRTNPGADEPGQRDPRA